MNGGFETTSARPTTPGGQLYNASNWTLVDPNIPPNYEASTGVCLITSCGAPFGPHSGSAYFYGGAWDGIDHVNSSPGTVSQEVLTTSLTLYVLSFWLAQPAAGATNSWEVTWDGVTFDSGSDLPPFPYRLETVLLLSSTAGSDTVKFEFYDSAPDGQLAGYELDDVSIDPLFAAVTRRAAVTSNSVIPEPGSGVLVTIFFGVTGLVGVFKRRSARARTSERPDNRVTSNGVRSPTAI